MSILDPETIGNKIDGALNVLNASSLSHFLNLNQLGITEIDPESDNGTSAGSQVLAARRAQVAINNSVAAAKAILGALYPNRAAEDRHDGDEQNEEDPISALRRALEAALERLLGKTQGGISDLDTHAKRQAAHEAVTLVRQETQRLRELSGGSDFTLLLTSELHKAFDRRWNLLKLSEDGKSLFHPLVQVAGQHWGQGFDAWRTRCGTHIRALDASTLVNLWLDGEHAHGASLVSWIKTYGEHYPNWQAQFTEWAKSQSGQSHLIRAAMGVSTESEATRTLPSLLNEAAEEAGRSLSIIEASLAWDKAVQNDVD